MRASWFGIGMLLAGLTGCSVVTSVDPVGETVPDLELEAWEGTWMHEEGTMNVRVIDLEQGRLGAAWLDDLEVEKADVLLRQSGDWLFVSLKEKPEDEGYLWARIALEDDRLILWMPHVDRIKALVEDGVLPGVVKENGSVRLEKLGPEHHRLLASEERGVLLDWEKPMVLRRITSD